MEDINFMKNKNIPEDEVSETTEEEQVQRRTGSDAQTAPDAFVMHPQTRRTSDFDMSQVEPGTEVRHKVFGIGTVKEIQGAYIIVTFNGTDRKFRFPEGFDQGFLTLAEK